MRLPLNTISQMDIFDLCDCLEDDSIDMILCDLPYGITACEWDNVIPFDEMWECFKRIIKPRGAIVLTASQPFTSQLVMSNLEMFKYEWIWEKNIGSNFATSKYQPIKEHENITVFCKGATIYNPIKQERKQSGEDRVKSRISLSRGGDKNVYGDGMNKNIFKVYDSLRLPRSIQVFNVQKGQHPTQKPVSLFSYLIRTYTQPGETVFDPTCGSGTTAIAARNTGRNYICGDSSAEYVDVARKRLAQPYTVPMFEEVTNNEPKPVQAALEL